jgi:hypothetical protein
MRRQRQQPDPTLEEVLAAQLRVSHLHDAIAENRCDSTGKLPTDTQVDSDVLSARLRLPFA